MKHKIIILSILLLLGIISRSQIVYHHINYENIYEFLDELANIQIIDLNTVAKPYSRKQISEKLDEAWSKRDELNKRQLKEISFYKREFTSEQSYPDSLSSPIKHLSILNNKYFSQYHRIQYKDSLFTLSVKPIFGYHMFSNKNGFEKQRWGGIDVFAYIGKFGFYANLRDNTESIRFCETKYLNQNIGVKYKSKNEYSEMRGGITYDWNWGNIGLVKDHYSWGNNNHGANIFSGKQPSYTFLKLNINPTKWFDFNYVHGWLVSEVIDSNRTFNYGNNMNRSFMHNKNIAANLFTIKPIKNIRFSVGNSIIYNDNVKPSYLIPIFFYKSVDHTLNGLSNYTGQNAQMFADISSRLIKNTHMYGAIFMDELNKATSLNDSLHSNFFSIKTGMSYTNKKINTTFIIEYTRSNPIVFRHFIPTTTFESNLCNMGHYLRDNSQELYFCIRTKPIPRLQIDASYFIAQHGEDYDYLGFGGTGLGLPFMDEVKWQNKTFAIKSKYEVLNEGFVFVEWIYSDITESDISKGINVDDFTNPYFQGILNTVSFGMNLGF